MPVEDGSLTDLLPSSAARSPPSEVNAAFAAPPRRLAGVLRYSTDALVSRDIIGDRASCVFDSPLTQASGDLVKIFGWYDNELGYTSRLIDLAAIIAARL